MKRKNMFMKSLGLAMLLTACLTGCGEKEEEKADNANSDTNAVVSEEKTDKADETKKPAENSAKIFDIPDEFFGIDLKTAELDLNNDGKKEKVDIDILDEDYVTLTINRGEADEVSIEWFDETPDEKFTIFNLRNDDDFLEVALKGDGPSGDPSTVFFRYDGKDISEYGTVPADVKYSNIKDGILTAKIRADMIYSAYGEVEYTIADKGFLIEEQWIPLNVEDSENRYFNLIKDLRLNESTEPDAENFIVKKGTHITPVKMLNNNVYVSTKHENSAVNWMAFKCEDGKIGYLAVYENDYIFDGNDNYIPGYEAFDEVPMAG